MKTTTEFLTQNLFEGLEYETKAEDSYVFQAGEFLKVIQRCSQNGVGIYRLLLWKDGEVSSILSHEDFHKKATDVRWAKSAVLKHGNTDESFLFSAQYKISEKLLNKPGLFTPKHEEEE